MRRRHKNQTLTFMRNERMLVPLVYKLDHWQRKWRRPWWVLPKGPLQLNIYGLSYVLLFSNLGCSEHEEQLCNAQQLQRKRISVLKISTLKYLCWQEKNKREYCWGHCPWGDRYKMHAICTLILKERSLKNSHWLWITQSRSNHMYSCLRMLQGGISLKAATYDRVLQETLRDTGLGNPAENNQWAYITHFFKKKHVPFFSKILADHKTIWFLVTNRWNYL